MALTSAVTIVVTACGTATVQPTGYSVTKPAQLAASKRPSPASPAATRPEPSNQQRAEQDAAAILAAFVAPLGARRLTAAPAAALKIPAQLSATPDMVDKASWWRVVGDPQQVLSWAAKHVPHRFTPGGGGSEDQGAGTTWEDTFELPAVPGVLDSRQLTIEVADAGGGQTGIRVDAQVTWLPERTPGETIPSGSTAVTVTLDPDVNVHVKPPKPVTITDPAKVRKLVALINGLPLFPSGSYSCPANGGGQLVLTFRTDRGDTAVAVATVALEGCEGVALVIDGVDQPGLGTLGGGRQVAAQALKLAGLDWNPRPYLF